MEANFQYFFFLFLLFLSCQMSIHADEREMEARMLRHSEICEIS